MQQDKKKEKKYNQQLLDFLNHSPTPFHAVENLLELFLDAGFRHLSEAEDWSNLDSGKYVITRNQSSIIAFSSGTDSTKTVQQLLSGHGLRMLGAHTDSPCLKLKPNSLYVQKGYVQLGVEVYGGALLNPWFDRDLSIAGRVTASAADGSVENFLIDFKSAVAVIPSLAIHLDRQANNERSINAQTDIVPICFQDENSRLDEKHWQQILLKQLAHQYRGKVKNIDTILASELSLYDTQKAAYNGLNKDFISSARLDNLLSCFVGSTAMIQSDSPYPVLFVANDHEEIGSRSASGAQSNFLLSVLQRLCINNENLYRCMSQSLLVSADNAHGVHPNFSAKHEPRHEPYLNAGPVIKVNSNQRYATNSDTMAWFKHLADQCHIPVQYYTIRTDMECGSTIGPLVASNLGVRTIDVGLATFAMHSIREMAGSHDPLMFNQFLRYYYSSRKITSK